MANDQAAAPRTVGMAWPAGGGGYRRGARCCAASRAIGTRRSAAAAASGGTPPARARGRRCGWCPSGRAAAHSAPADERNCAHKVSAGPTYGCTDCHTNMTFAKSWRLIRQLHVGAEWVLEDILLPVYISPLCYAVTLPSALLLMEAASLGIGYV